MRYPKSESFGAVKGPDGRYYSRHFRGENEGLATITGPSAPGGGVQWVKEIFSEPAETPDEAQRKISQYCRAQGWPE